MEEVLDDILMHYGMPRRSGRYPWGSGDNPYQRTPDFYSRVNDMRKNNFTYTDENGVTYTGDVAIAKSMGLTTTQLRVQYTRSKNERRALEVEKIKSLQEDGYSLTEIAKMLGYKNESSIRSKLNENAEARMNAAQVTAELLKKQVAEKGFIDVGTGTEASLGISKEKLKEALYILQLEGYEVYGVGVPQVTNPGKQTNIKVLCPPGTKHSEVYSYDQVHTVEDYVSYDQGESFRKAFEYPSSMDPNRLSIRYAEEGGLDKDGTIEIRPGVKDLSLGDAHYAQVRIMVDNDLYLKGMAFYGDEKDFPPGVDVIFNTNKKLGTSMADTLKPIKNDPENPFGSAIKEHGGQSYYDDPDGKYVDPLTGQKQSLSLINKRAEEGDWDQWSNALPSQFLAKQSQQLIDKQLNLAIADKKEEFDTICSLTNPTVKRELLASFADDCDAASVHLQAAALPRQRYQVILPINDLSENEVYAPNFRDGEQIALVRYPHAGTFELPILTVNNKNQQGIDILGKNPKDAIGINKKVADRLSGADFDGDTVMCIPTNSKVKITSTDTLPGLKDFTTDDYGCTEKKTDANGVTHYYRDGKEYKLIKKSNVGREMGEVSNLIMDMTLKGATTEELTKAVKHSMVIIDAEKHHLDYKQSEVENDIAALKKKYQGHYAEDGSYHEGASTLITSAKSPVQVLKRKGSPKIDPDTGEVSYKEVYETYTDKKTGKTKVRTQESTKMAETKDARTLISEEQTPQEKAYATYANTMKALANQARKEQVSTPLLKYNAQANKTYANEVSELKSQLSVALSNAPKERQAQLIANTTMKAKKLENPAMTKEEKKKEANKALQRAREQVGAKRNPITISDKQWEAIQAGAVSDNVLTQILKYTDKDSLKQKAMPRATSSLSAAQVSVAKAMKNSGYTNAEIADRLGKSVSTVIKAMGN